MSSNQNTKKIPTQEFLNEITTFFFKLQLLNKVYHWKTTSYARHIATCKFNDSMQPIIDKFIEVFIGRYNIKPIVTEVNLRPENLTDDGIKQYFIRAKEYIEIFENNLSDTDLLNIRDELLAEINQTLYLFELK